MAAGTVAGTEKLPFIV